MSSSNSTPLATADPSARIKRKRKYEDNKISPVKVKKIMHSDPEIGKMSYTVPVAIGKVMEFFAAQLVKTASVSTPPDASSTLLTADHVKLAIRNDPQFAFLTPLCDTFRPKKLNTDVLKEEQDSSDAFRVPNLNILPPRRVSVAGEKKAGQSSSVEECPPVESVVEEKDAPLGPDKNSE